MLTWFKKLLRIVRDHDTNIASVDREFFFLRDRLMRLEGTIREHTSINADISVSQKHPNNIIVIGKYKGHDYIQTFSVRHDSVEDIIRQLKDMERFGNVDIVDEPPHIRGCVKRGGQWL